MKGDEHSMDDKIKIIDIDSDYYPDNLRMIRNPPERLYCIGNVQLLKKRSVAVIGSRKYTLYGKIVSQMIGKELALAKIPVISGLAYGIDSFSRSEVKQ